MGLCAYIHIAYGGYFIVEYELPQATKLVSLSEKKKKKEKTRLKCRNMFHLVYKIQTRHFSQFCCIPFLRSVSVWLTLTAMSWLAGYLETTYSSTMQNYPSRREREQS